MKNKLLDLNNHLFAQLERLSEEDISVMATGQIPPDAKVDNGKNPAAVSLGRLGGLKGGKARAEALTPAKRKAIAKKAAASRWKK